ncbi:GNAT family N-acetyltransferase [Microbacterium sp. Se5.02b]|uniref:GNAT family N-acetyltransferase n=1 Tax=Microbacterium sp. Se5.02b TaxID=2864103 RepID=UPI001C68C482|nr:GNAT family N-acetyltransferase [Microbacterium sp. Se5.02b]QYM63963.1 GNAT family N-acetyltransferase [Microbacterium sp. Se5.02b]
MTADQLRLHAPQLLDLQHKAYAVEAARIGDDRIPPLHETEGDLLSSGLKWIASWDGGLISGAVGYAVEHDIVDLDRLMIHPAYHRRGLGRALVIEVMALAPRTVVATARENLPARSLYESLGFLHQSDVEATPGLWISRYSRTRA